MDYTGKKSSFWEWAKPACRPRAGCMRVAPRCWSPIAARTATASGQAARRADFAEIFTGPFHRRPLPVALWRDQPWVPLATPAIVDAMAGGLPVVGDVELFAQTIRGWDSKIIAITGANGKTTVTTLVGQMCMDAGLETVVAGPSACIVLDALEQSRRSSAGRVCTGVVELSAGNHRVAERRRRCGSERD